MHIHLNFRLSIYLLYCVASALGLQVQVGNECYFSMQRGIMLYTTSDQMVWMAYLGLLLRPL